MIYLLLLRTAGFMVLNYPIGRSAGVTWQMIARALVPLHSARYSQVSVVLSIKLNRPGRKVYPI